MSGGAPATVALTRLRLSAFRCYAEAALDTDARCVVLAGPNGAGKTNLLEAISFLAPGRGLRQARLSAVDRRLGAEESASLPWAVAARVSRPEAGTGFGSVELGTGRDPAESARERRVVKVDGAFAGSQATLAEWLSVLWLTPQMDRLLLEGSSARRRFLDRLCYGLDAAHAGRVAAYEHAVRERARLLRDGATPGQAAPDPVWLGVLEEQMAGLGVAVAATRRDLTARLNGVMESTAGAFPRAILAIAGAPEAWLDDAPALAAEERLRAALAASRVEDAASGMTRWGPHRSDLAVAHGRTGMPAAECSTGEQKALLLSILLAQARLLAAERGMTPVLLLDEVAAHLDEGRRAALFEALLALGAQAWLTGTDEQLFAPLDGQAQFFRVRDAVVVAR
jgi:DNA replication and repair protein RecF